MTKRRGKEIVVMNSRSRTMVYGALIGAATGLIAAMLLNRRAVRDERSTAITTGEGLKLGILLVGLLRAIASLGEDEKK
jgi:gas vesicle protein